MNVVVVGGGFGGVKTALDLANDKRFKVTLITDRDHFLFYPALYSTATGRSRQQSIVPLEGIFKGRAVRVVLDTVTGLDAQRRIVVGKKTQHHYDRVVFALGVVTSYFGIEGLDTFSYSIKSAREIDRFKKHLHDTLKEDKAMDANYIVVGAGPTGVELSASLTSYLKKIAIKHQVKNTRIRLSLVEAMDRVLPKMSPLTSKLALRQLKKTGVRVMLNKKVESEDDDSIMISGKDIPSKTVIWTSGVANHPFFFDHSDIFPLAKNGRVQTDNHLKIGKYIYVIGDNNDTPYSGLAQTALHDAKFAVKCLRAEKSNKKLPKYRSYSPPMLVPVGEKWAILQYGKIHLWGRAGSIMRQVADFIAYSELFPMGMAWKLWASEYRHEEDCAVCRKKD